MMILRTFCSHCRWNTEHFLLTYPSHGLAQCAACDRRQWFGWYSIVDLIRRGVKLI